MVAQMYRKELSSKSSNVDKPSNEVSRVAVGDEPITLLSVNGAALLADAVSTSPSPPSTFIEHDSSMSSASDTDMHGSNTELVNERGSMISPPPPQIPDLSLVEGLTAHSSDCTRISPRHLALYSSVSSSLSQSPFEVSLKRCHSGER